MRIFTEYPTKIENPKFYNYGIDSLIFFIQPPQRENPIFKKFGQFVNGVWEYNTEWYDLSNEDKWQYLAYCLLDAYNNLLYKSQVTEFELYLKQLEIWSEKNPKFLDTINKLKESKAKILENE